MTRGLDAGWGSWAVFAALLTSSSVVLGLQWNEECDGGLRTWLLVAVCVTALSGALGGLFHGRGDGTRPSRFLDDDADYVDDDSRPGQRDVVGRLDDLGQVMPGPPLPSLVEEGGVAASAASAKGAGGKERASVNGARDSMDEESITSGHGSSISVQLASRASSSLQHQYFGPGPKVFPDVIFLFLVLSQWFLAVWSVIGAALYFRLFQGNRTCAPLLRHWTLLVVIIGFLSCLLTVCYSGIMCCMLGSPFGSRMRRDGNERDRFHGDISSSGGSSSNSSTANGTGLM